MSRAGFVSSTTSVLLFLAMVLSAGVPASAQSDGRVEKWLQGPLLVTGTEIHEDEILHVNGSWLVAPGSTLILRHTEVIFDGAGPHAFGIQPSDGVSPAGEMRLESTPSGSTVVRSAARESNYFFSTYGRFIAQGLPEAPVIITNVTGYAGGINPSAVNSGTFLNGLMLVGPYNQLDWVAFGLCESGIGISSRGDTRIANSSIYLTGVGLYLYQAGNVRVENTSVSSLQSAVVAHKAAGITIRDSSLYGGKYGVIADQSRLTFVNDVISGGREAAHVYQNGEYSFEASTFRDYHLAGLKANIDPRSKTGSATGHIDLDVTSSTFLGDGNGSTGIAIFQARDVRLEGNRVLDHTDDGIAISTSTEVTLRGNTLERNERYGVEILGAKFTQDQDVFGKGDDANGIDALLGNVPVTLAVVDGSGAPVPGAAISLFRPDVDSTTNASADAKGAYSMILEGLYIYNHGQRSVREYVVTASAEGLPTITRTIRPYEEQMPIVLRLAEEAAPSPVETTSVGESVLMGPIGIGVLAVAGIGAILLGRTLLRRGRS